MLLELRVENYAVIDHAVAAFGAGLNLLTGETGAGKSILVDALALVTGGKASPEIIRHGAERAVVACVFEATPAAEATLEANGIDAQDAEIVLRREIQTNGKGRVFVNNQPATVAVLRRLAPDLVSIHAQAETLKSFGPIQQRELLDHHAGIAITELPDAYQRWRAASERLRGLEENEQSRLRQADLWSYERREIEGAHPQLLEDDALANERRVLANAEKLYSAAQGAFEQLYEGGSSAAAALKAALRNVEEIARYDAGFREVAEQIASVRVIVDDAAASLRDYAGKIQASPDRLAEIEDRLALLDRLKRKYGPTLADVIAYGETVSARLAEIEDRDRLLAEAAAARDQTAAAYRAAAERTTEERIAAAEKLEKVGEKHIGQLALKARLSIGVTAQREEEHWSGHGWDKVEFRISANPGEPVKPLEEIASGGEMSRILLALKVSAEEGPGKRRSAAIARDSITRTPVRALVRTLVFDEIDIGIGGKAAEAVGQKLKTLSRGQQVLCVTHLPQIAAFANQHFVVEKRERKGRTETSIRLLTRSERTEELARMLSGAKLTETSFRHAEQMLADAER